ncbi:MAG: roadblock/LC7 domain-containing protein [Candidatus Odinarchaeum yellowstonii]|jgi:predicted regulator of Ras-like GTPase activity (Roadblock/LC7/MglB family)|uniref:Roadblock/LC7 domain-containing protein n=1 Tax=Odinarchaeota yellowstonii (strain LCB_4) TaxID=1841599 RepID=A0AAF0D1G1_ODILC|nr:MAG: roadblock/LC7 domain-containing protein [Candidatus Odinarchaeum yellowstonii]
MDPKILESKLATMMDEIPEIEGLLAFDYNGKLICGQTLTELDKDKLIVFSREIFKNCSELASSADKGKVATITITTDRGYLIIEMKQDFSILALLGAEAASSLSLVIRSLKVAL